MVRLGNRRDGNTGEYCMPVSVLEDGAEKAVNLRKTTMSPERNEIFESFESTIMVQLQFPGKRHMHVSCMPHPTCATILFTDEVFARCADIW
jgi:hypothetical protein